MEQLTTLVQVLLFLSAVTQDQSCHNNATVHATPLLVIVFGHAGRGLGR